LRRERILPRLGKGRVAPAQPIEAALPHAGFRERIADTASRRQPVEELLLLLAGPPALAHPPHLHPPARMPLDALLLAPLGSV